jgi:prevent-host-death family protein
MREIPVTEARAQLSDLVSQVAFGGEPVVLTRHGKALVALVPAALLGGRDPVAGDVTPGGAPLILDVTTLDGSSQGHYTLAAHHDDTDKPIR